MIARRPFPAAAFVGLACLALVLVSTGCEETTVSVLDVSAVEVSPAEITLFEGQETTVSVTLRERDGGEVSGREIIWTSDDPSVATVEGGVVHAHERGTTRIHAESEGVRGSADVTVLLPPEIEPSRSSVVLEAEAGATSPAEDAVQIGNGGEGTLDGLSVATRSSGGGSAPWLTATLDGATAPTVLRLFGRSRDLPAGTYEAVVDVASDVAHNSPVQVGVRFEVREPPPRLRVDPSSVSFSASSGAHEPATVNARVENAGGGTLSSIQTSIRYQGEATGWLDVVASGTTAPVDLLILASARFLDPGEYHAAVVVSSPVAQGGSVEIAVVFTVQ